MADTTDNNATGDSSMSASELRQRYNRGGTAKDDELSASQLRARHGVQKNSSSKYKYINQSMNIS
mgnify:CR=1 FL=1